MTRNIDFASDPIAELCASQPLPESILCGGVHYIPSPTWRPIAEMPKEWRDGRWVAIVESAHRPWKAAQWDNGALVDEDDCECDPTLFLDLTIPEVPHA